MEQKDKLIQELGAYKVKYTQEVLSNHPYIMNKDDERLRNTTIAFLKDFADKGYENAVECIDWLEKRGEQKLLIEKLPEEMKTIGESLGFTTQEECDNYNQMVTDLIMSDDDKNEQESAWSEDDELHIRELESLVKQVWTTAEHENDKDTIHKMSDLSFFLKTLKPQPKQEWSKEKQDII